MEANWFNIFQASASTIGLLIIIYQISHLRKTMLASAHDRLEAHYLEVTKSFLAKPHLRPYFYQNAKLDSDTGNRRSEIDMMSEILLGLIEHASLQKDNLTDETWDDCWEPYAMERLSKSIELRNFLNANRSWYTRGMIDLLDKYNRSHGQTADAAQA